MLYKIWIFNTITYFEIIFIIYVAPTNVIAVN